MTGTGAARPGEEMANVLSHGIGLALAIAATPILIVNAARGGTAGDIVGGSVFGATMIALYLASTVYHAAPPGRLRDRLQRLDHVAIYLLIAGTYTPFTLGVLGGGWGWTLFGLVWGCAVIGTSVKLLGTLRHSRVSTALYLAMGWLVVIAMRPLTLALPPAGLAWLFAGGIMYSVGAAVYSARSLPYGHFVWHLFVMAGTACHFLAVLGYAV